MSVTPPEAPPYPTTPEEIHPDDDASVAAYAQILVRFFFFFYCKFILKND